MERIEHEAEVLEGNDSEQGFRIVGIAQYYWRMALSFGERKVAFRHRP